MSMPIDTDDQAINHLLTVLAQDKSVSSPAVLNNLVYYTPRTKSVPQLIRLVNAIFKGTSRPEFNVLELFEMSQAIAQWKLEISEPAIPPAEFYKIWDSCFRECYSWTRSKLSILAGILSTRENFRSLETGNFIDDSRQIIKLYDSWKRDIFIPTWCEFVKRSNRDIASLILIYAAISSPSDACRYGFLPWNVVTIHLSRLFLRHMTAPGQAEPFFEKNLSRMAKTLQTSLTKSDKSVVSDFLSLLCRGSYDLAFFELRNQTQTKDYSKQYYSHVLFTAVVSLNSILQTTAKAPTSWYAQVVMILFNLNFIAEDIGIVGFDSYQSVYEIVCKGITLADDQAVYYDTVKVMNGNIWGGTWSGNKVNRAKLLFMLRFMGSTLSELSSIPIPFINDFIQPLQKVYMDSTEEDIRESAHIMTLSIFSSHNNDADFLRWECQNYLPYLDLSTNQFLRQKISDKQLILIYQKMSSQLPILQHVDGHLSREALHYTYLTILNCPPQQLKEQAVLLKCLIFQILYSNEHHLVDWLDTTQELLSSIKFTNEQRHDIITTLWDVVSHSKSDVAFKWWYGRLDAIRSRL
ncbi:hypothetical protein HG536_0G02370 [Torulaspora globosa]|uniref:Uncharacterized protein n=1 Tax=Torulaspora globosa TaxID=48254 RepID=A0A7G3ZLJ0_9SACH|nr:uncharacterized protein HG536_0G02370 [Torulaspora globosa]QLL34376.1 hypothetical protein HG536_0G02370 [Torulaspora globosa]